MSTSIVADVDGVVFAYSDGALLIVIHAPSASPFGPAFGPVRREIDGKCVSVHPRDGYVPQRGDPKWVGDCPVTIYRVWDECPPYEHECAEVKARVTG